jgi:endonuclease YncB( thermonuclease family)
MKKFLLSLLIAFLVPCILLAGGKGSGKSSSSSGKTVHVNGYYRKDGTYVAPHYRRPPGSGSSSTTVPYPSESPLTPNNSPHKTETPRPTAEKTPIKDLPKAPAKEKPTFPKDESKEGKVIGVTDGDTLTLLVDKTQYKIRLYGIDAPESKQAYGTQAKKALSGKVFGKQVQVTSNGVDKYGRTLGTVEIDKRIINTEMVEEGMAWHYKQFTKSETLATAEEKARNAKSGLWADEKPTPPWEWRHSNNEKDSVDDASKTEPTVEKRSKAEPTTESQQSYWITESSNKRHNSGCKYYKNSKGHSCGPSDGVACKICGG